MSSSSTDVPSSIESVTLTQQETASVAAPLHAQSHTAAATASAPETAATAATEVNTVTSEISLAATITTTTTEDANIANTPAPARSHDSLIALSPKSDINATTSATATRSPSPYRDRAVPGSVAAVIANINNTSSDSNNDSNSDSNNNSSSRPGSLSQMLTPAGRTTGSSRPGSPFLRQATGTSSSAAMATSTTTTLAAAAAAAAAIITTTTTTDSDVSAATAISSAITTPAAIPATPASRIAAIAALGDDNKSASPFHRTPSRRIQQQQQQLQQQLQQQEQQSQAVTKTPAAPAARRGSKFKTAILSLIVKQNHGDLSEISPELVVEMLRYGTMHNFSGLLSTLKKCSHQWICKFLSLDGLDALLKSLSSAKSSSMNLKKALDVVHTALCVKAVLNHKDGIDFLVDGPPEYVQVSFFFLFCS